MSLGCWISPQINFFCNPPPAIQTHGLGVEKPGGIMPVRPATAGKEEAFMKRSWRTGGSIHSMTGGTCQGDDPKAGREEKLPALAGLMSLRRINTGESINSGGFCRRRV
jgi:hypothetical protein